MPNSLEDNATLILSAHFDNKLGPIINGQYPNGPNKLPNYVVNLMIPANAEKTPGIPDFTIIILYQRNEDKCVYELFPSAGSHPVYFLNACIANLDKNNERGTTIKSIAIGSRLKPIMMFKPLLLMFLNFSFAFKDSQNLQDCLEEFYKMLNSVDLSLVKDLLSLNHFQDIYKSLNDELPQKEMNIAICKLLERNDALLSDDHQNQISYKQDVLYYHFTRFDTELLPDFMKKIPLKINLFNDDIMNSELEYNKQVLPLCYRLTKINPDFEKCKIIIIMSTKMTMDDLSQFIVAFAFLLENGKSNKVLTFPYMDISIINQLKIFHKNQSLQEYDHVLIGTNNPIFQIKNDICDFYYNLDELKLQSNFVSPSVALNNRFDKLLIKEEWKNQSRSITNAIKNPMANIIVHNNVKITLMTKFLKILFMEKHNNRTTINVIKRITILQILSLMNNHTGIVEKNSSGDFEKLYKQTYKDLISYNNFFKKENLIFIENIFNLHKHWEILNTLNYNTSSEKVYLTLTEIHEVTKKLILIINKNQAMTFEFIHVCLNFPNLKFLTYCDLKNEILMSTNILDIYDSFSKLERFNSVNSKNNVAFSLVDKFLSHNAFSIISEFLRQDLKFSNNTTTSNFIDGKSKLLRSGSLRTFFSTKSSNDQHIKTKLNFINSLSGLTTAANITKINNSTVERSNSLREPINVTLFRSKNSGSNESLNKLNILHGSPLLNKWMRKIKLYVVKLLDIISEVPLGENIINTYLDDSILKIYQIKRNTKPILNSKKANIQNDSDLCTLFSLDNTLREQSIPSTFMDSNTSANVSIGESFFDAVEFPLPSDSQTSTS